MADVSLGGKPEATPTTEEKQKLIYMGIPSVIMMLIDLSDSKNISKYTDPMVKTIKKSMTNKELRKLLCQMFGVKTAKKFKRLKPQDFDNMTKMFGNIWGLK